VSRTEPGWRAWASFALAAGFFGHEFVQRVSPSVVVGELMAEFAVGAAVFGSLTAFYFYAYAGMQIPVGILMDRFGPRRLMAFAAGVSALGAVLFATAPSLGFAYAGRLLIGFGASFSWIGILTVATLWLPAARFSSLVGIGQAAGMAGAMLGQAPLSLVVDVAGWRLTVGLLATVGATIALAIWTVVPDVVPRAQAVRGQLVGGLRVAARSRETWLNGAFGLAMTGTMLAFAGLWAVPWLVGVHGYARAEAAAFASAMFLGWAIGSPIIGLLSDRARRRRPFMVACGFAMAASLATILYAGPFPAPMLVALMFVNGACASSMVLAYGAARDHNPPEASGAVYGIVNAAVVGSGALFQPLIGLLLDLKWDGAMQGGVRVYDPGAYAAAFAVLPLAALLGTLAACLSREAARA
jgi:MFS family permease